MTKNARKCNQWTALAVSMLPLVAVGVGCAKTTYREATSASSDGVRYYAPATYLLVKPDYKKSMASLTLLTLPDTKQLYAVDSYSWMASNETKIDFKNGMIKKSVSDMDSVKVPTAAIEGLATIAKAALDAAAAQAKIAAAASGAQMLPSPKPAAPKAPPVFLYYVEGTSLTCVFPEGGCP